MIGRLLHGSDIVIDACGDTTPGEGYAGKDQVNPQAARRVCLETATAIVEPAEPVIRIRVANAEGIHQTPLTETLQPLPLFGQETALAGAQPPFGVLLTDADIPFMRCDVHVTDHQQPLLGS